MDEMSEDKYHDIEEVLSNIPDQFCILEEVVDIDIQKEYFEATQKIKIDPELDTEEKLSALLYTPESSIDVKKEALLKLASMDSVNAYRVIEKYKSTAEKELEDWSTLAFQQSKMIIQSSLLGEQQVFISTGLGGKQNKLRYFLIFPFVDNRKISQTQIKLLEDELKYSMNKQEAEVESVEVTGSFVTAMALIPIKTAISDLIQEILEECNQYGNFLSTDVMITNVKKLDEAEIIKLLSKLNETT